MRIQESFGAEVEFTLPESERPQLFLIVASSGARPSGRVRAYGGRITLDGGGWTIAELGFEEAVGLRNTEGIAFVGGISLDAERFAAFSKHAGMGSLQGRE